MTSTATGAEVFLPGALRERAGGAGRVAVAGATVAELIAALEEAHPGLRFSLCYETGELRPFVNIFVNGTNVRYLAGLETAVPVGARVYILPSVAGG
jgi:molybdopterin converting factor small subunit